MKKKYISTTTTKLVEVNDNQSIDPVTPRTVPHGFTLVSQTSSTTRSGSSGYIYLTIVWTWEISP